MADEGDNSDDGKGGSSMPSSPSSWLEQDLKAVRKRAALKLSDLKQQVSKETPSVSWVQGSPHEDPSDRCRFFNQYGFVMVRNFADASEITSMKQQMKDLAEGWDPAAKTVSFRTDEKANEKQGSDDYFLESASRVHFFAEPDALEQDSSKLKPMYKNDKLQALNKAGHGMHMIPGAFCNYCTSLKIRSLVKELGWTDPVVPQSMYIFKQPYIGGAVNSHQDSTFLFTEPRQSCLGLWLALDDATLENGCLWVRPSSHVEPVRRQFQRNVAYFGQDAIDNCSNVGEGDLTQPKMIMKHHVSDENSVAWEGLLPTGSDPPCEGLMEAGFVPVECKAGDLLAFCGQLDHLSLPNYSDSQRHTFQLHLVEGPEAGVAWSKSNWLQYPKGTPFLSMK